jgi:hypothetical protein
MSIVSTKFARAGSGFVACGVYGCGVYPAVPCAGEDAETTDAVDSQEVSKLFVRNEAFEKELAEYGLIGELDPAGVYTVPLVRQCGINPHDVNPDVKLKFEMAGREIMLDKQIRYEYGGPTVYSMFRSPVGVPPSTLERILMVEVPKMFDFLMIMRRRGVGHNDIHPHNITYLDTKGLRLIDFGMVFTFREPRDEDRDKGSFGSVLVFIVDFALRFAPPALQPSLQNARILLKKLYDLLDIEEAKQLWQAAMRETDTATFVHSIIKPALFRVTSDKLRWDKNKPARAEAMALVENSAASVEQLERLLKKRLYDVMLETKPWLSAQRDVTETRIENPNIPFDDFSRNLSLIFEPKPQSRGSRTFSY